MAIAGGSIYAAPYFALDNLKKATTNHNADALAQGIDFPSLRMSVKENIKALVLAQISAKNTPDRQLDPKTVAKIVDPLVDKIVTPEGLGDLIQAKIPRAEINLDDIKKRIAAAKIQTGYESFDRFVVHITDKIDRDRAVSLILKRNGLDWKLSGIDISKV